MNNYPESQLKSLSTLNNAAAEGGDCYDKII